MAIGLIAIFLNKINMDKSLFPSTIHAVMGTFGIIGVIVQVIIGMEKMDNAKPHGISATHKSRRWHGNAGLLTWDILGSAMLLGMLQFFELSFLNFSAVLSFLVLWLSVHMQIRIPILASGQDHSNGTGFGPSHESTSIASADRLHEDAETSATV